MNKMFSLEEVKAMISEGKHLLLAAEEELLAQLPEGNWIAGSIPYFMGDEGGQIDQKRLFVTELDSVGKNIQIKSYSVDQLKNIYSDLPKSGFGVVIIPGLSEAHSSFAINAPMYPNFASSPLMGWISGIHLDDLGKKAPVVWSGKEGLLNNSAVVMSAEVDEAKVPNLDIVNLFEQGDGDELEFVEEGFQVTKVLVNGEERDFAEYLKSNNIDTRWPLVADYAGAMVNVSFQAVNDDSVDLYAPVFKDMPYKLAKPIENYSAEFEKALPAEVKNLSFSCNCILNFLYGELEGKKTSVNGPMTFGEIAYQLLNQTMVYLTLDDK